MQVKLLVTLGMALCGLAAPGSAQRVVDAGSPALVIGSVDDDSTSVLFGVTSAVRLGDGRIVVANTGTFDLRMYDAQGRHLRNIGRKGKGPGEFSFLQRVGRMRGDTLLTYDIGLGRISRFSPEGELLGSVQVQPFDNGVLPLAVGFLDDGRMLAHTDFGRVFGRGERRDTVTYVLFTRDGVPRDTLGHYPGVEEFHLSSPNFATRRPVMFGRDTYAGVAGRFIVVGASDHYAIDIFLAENKLRTYTRPHEQRAVDARDLDTLNDEYLATVSERIRTAVRARIDEFPARETHPAFTGLLAGRDGSLWIRRSESPRERQQTWDVFAQTATVPVAVRFPRAFQLLEAGEDYALGRFRDELGVEYVHLYRLR